MQSKTTNFSIYAVFGARFGVHFVILFSVYSKSRSRVVSQTAFRLLF